MMDSFYDVPRLAPTPTAVEKFLISPVVPEVSLCGAKVPLKEQNNCIPWMNEPLLDFNMSRENILRPSKKYQPANLTNSNFSQCSRKQVRFESPVLQQKPTIRNDPFVRKRDDFNNLTHANNSCFSLKFQEATIPVQTKDEPSGRTNFEQIYMANIPNRHLDLSIIDLPKRSELSKTKQLSEVQDEILENKENTLPKTYREYLETQRKIAKAQIISGSDSVTDILNYKRNKEFNIQSGEDYRDSIQSNDVGTDYTLKLTKSSPLSNKRSPEFEPSTDLNSIESFPLTEKRNPNCQVRTDFEQNHYRYHSQTTNRLYENISVDHNLPFKKQCYSGSNFPLNMPLEIIEPQQNFSESREVCCHASKSNKTDCEPTNRDLLKIIAQQNEQLLLLQKQVAMLLNRENNSVKPIEPAPPKENFNIKPANELPRQSLPDVSNTSRKRGLSKFSVDVMTSFEVAIRPQHNRQNFVNCEPKIQEITELESLASTEKNEKMQSLHFQDPVEVREMCPSPEPSININMNDYDSSDEEVSASEIGATFYRNLMGQVNDILRKAHIQTRDDLASRGEARNGTNSEKNDKTMNRVKEATLKHLRSIGVTIEPLEDGSVSFEQDSKEYSPTEVSFAVKQLLMKYLPDEHLAKATCRKQQVQKKTVESTGIISARPEFSFASLQYMKKYNLIPSTDPVPTRKQRQYGGPPQTDCPKILDITALKMQPKLL